MLTILFLVYEEYNTFAVDKAYLPQTQAVGFILLVYVCLNALMK